VIAQVTSSHRGFRMNFQGFAKPLSKWSSGALFPYCTTKKGDEVTQT
jgi:hypothetical protein